MHGDPMKRIVALSLFLGIAVASAFARDANADFKKYVAGIIPKIARALESSDVKFFDSISTPDFTEVEGGKSYSKADALKEMKSMKAMVKSTKCTMTMTSAKLVGDKGISEAHGSLHTVMKPDKSGKSHTMDIEFWSKQTWVKSGNGWKMQKLEDTKPSKMKMDGKPMDMSKMGGG